MILFIQTAFLGDLLLSIPTLKKLRELYPQKKIHVLCRKGLGSFLVHQGLADQVFDQFEKTKPSIAEVKQQLGSNHYDLLVCAHQSVRSNILCAFIKADKKIGYKNFWNVLVFDHREQRHMEWPEVLRQLDLLQSLDKDLAEKLLGALELKSPFKNIPAWSSMVLRSNTARVSKKKTVAVAPGSVWPTKRWDKFSELTGQLLKSGYEVILIGSPAEKEVSEEIKKQFPAVTDMTGKTNLTQMLDVLAVCDALVCNDSGAMHMASILNLPTVAIFGPTVLEFGYQPWNDKAVVVEHKTLSCRPCSSHGTVKCPIGTHECMTALSADQVLDQVRYFLA